MIKQVLGVEVIIQGVKVALIDNETNLIVPGTTIVRKDVDARGSADHLFGNWTDAINECLQLNSGIATHIGMAMPGQLEFEDGISYIQNQNKFDAIYGLNVRDLISEKTNIPSENIKIQNNSMAFMAGEVILGAVKGYQRPLCFTLDSGFGTARYINEKIIDANLWEAPFKDGIAEDYLGIRWFAKRYHEFTGHQITNIKELSTLADTDDGIGQIVFNEYSENFVNFLIHDIKLHNTDLVLIGGHDEVWDRYIPHVKDRLSDKRLLIPIKQALNTDTATLIGAANIW